MMIRYVLLLALGLVFAFAGIIVYFVVAAEVRKQLLQSLIIDSTSHPNYYDWISPENATDAAQYLDFFLWNLTNPYEFLAGAAPVVAEVGPLSYRYYNYKLDANFFEGGNKVRYRSRDVYQFQPSRSQVAETDLLYQINPFYIAAVSSFGSEAALQLGLVSGAFAQLLPFASIWGSSQVCLVGSICTFAKFSAGARTFTAAESIVLITIFSNPMMPPTFAQLYMYLKNPVKRPFALQALNATFYRANIDFAGESTDFTAGLLMGYLQNLVAPTLQTTMTLTGSVPSLGLAIKYASTKDMIFTPDRLAGLMGVAGASFYVNHSTADMAKQFNTLRTGKDNTDYANMDFYIEYLNVTNITAYPSVVDAVNYRLTSMSPFQTTSPDNVVIYFPQAQRSIIGSLAGSADVEGIETWQYTFSAQTVAATSVTYTSFIMGLLNITMLSPLPMFLSAPHMTFVDSTYRNLVVGQSNAQFDTAIFVEPMTGLAIDGHKQLQANLLINHTSTAYTTITKNTSAPVEFIPMFWVRDSKRINPDTAATLRKAVVDSVLLRKLVLGILVGVGIAFVLIGAMMMVHRGSRDGPSAAPEGDQNPQQEMEKNPMQAPGPSDEASVPPPGGAPNNGGPTLASVVPDLPVNNA